MKSSAGVLLLCFVAFACSQKSKETVNATDDSNLTLDTLAKFNETQLKAMDSTTQDILFKDTRQEIFRSKGYVEVKLESFKKPESNRTDIPHKWKTSQGVYVGITMDSLEMINGVPFYMSWMADRYTVANWEGGKLAQTGVRVDFIVERGGNQQGYISSRDIIDKGWTTHCVTLRCYSGKGWGEPTQVSKGYPGDYPFLSFKELTEADLDAFDIRDVRMMRNEIFARYGYIFKSEDLKEHFSIKPWYTPKAANVDALLTPVEKANISLMRDKEIRYRNRPLAKLIRTLPFLELPSEIDVVGPPHYLDSLMMADLGVAYDMTEVAVFGLLPDTSRVYAVMWTGYSPYTGVGVTDGSQSFQIFTYVTTFDKNANQIQSALVKMSAPSNLAYNSETCPLQVNETFMMKRDWSYQSEYTIDWSCKVENRGVLLPSDQPISGKIEKDGTIH